MAKKKQSDFIDIPALLKSYATHWYLFIISLALCMAIAGYYVHIRKDKYVVHANLMVQGENKSPLAGLSDLGDLLGGGSSGVQDEIYVISSHSLYRQVVKDLGLNKMHYLRLGIANNLLLYPEWPVDVYASESVLDSLKYAFNFKVTLKKDGKADIDARGPFRWKEKFKNVTLPYIVKTDYGEFTVDRTKYCPKDEQLCAKVNIMGYNLAAEKLAKDISSDIASKKGNVIELAYTTTTPIMGEALLDDIIRRYNERGISETNAQALKTAQFLDDRIKLLANDLTESETALQQFKERNGIIDVEHEAKYQSTKRAAIEEQLIKAQTELEVLGLTRDFISQPDNKYELIPVAVEGSGLQSIIGDYNKLIIQRNDMLKTARPENANVVRVTDQINSMRAGIISSVNQLYNNASVNVRDLRSQMGSTGSRLSNVPSQERAVIDMARQLEVKQQLFLFLRQRQEENAMIMANALPKGTIVDEAYTSTEPLGMSKYLILIIAFIIGLCLPPVYIYVVKLFRNRFETRDEVERLTSVPVLGEMCTDHSGRSMVVSPTDTSSATELFRLMRANLLFVLNDVKDKVVLVTSSVSGEGKSFIACNLAASLALLEKKVLLVGMDIRAPKLSSYLGIPATPGLTQYLSSADMQLENIIQKAPVNDIPTMDIIVAGPIPPNPAELLTSRKVDETFTRLREMYDFIIVDSAPVGLVSDTFALNRISDATIYVTRVNYTSATRIRELEDLYDNNRLKKLSLVVNGVKTKKSYGYRAKGKQE